MWRMDAGSFAEYLSGLDEASLTLLLQARPDVRVAPVPRGFAQLAQRLGGADSLVMALHTVNRDTVVVGQAIAALGPAATVPAVARLLGSPERAVRGGLADLCGRGLAWTSGARLCLPERLEGHWAAEIGGEGPVARLARSVLVEDLRSTAEVLGFEGFGLRKPELIALLSEVMGEQRSMVAAIAALPKPARKRLEEFRRGYLDFYPAYGGHRPRAADPTALLLEAGLLLRVNGRPALAREVAVAAWLAERDLPLTGPPDLPRSEVDEVVLRPTALAAAQEALRGVTALLDEARSKPIAALKKGGIGPRERARLSSRLSIPADALVLWIDLAYVAGLLGHVDSGYAPTEAFADWRAAPPGSRWAALAYTWLGLEHAPTSRDVGGDKELPPPLPLASSAGPLRRALLSAARSGMSVHAVGAEIDWYFPLHGYDPAPRNDKVGAAIREAELLGVVARDRVTELGEHLLAVTEVAATDELARRCAALLPEVSCDVILQSDLTAVVSGQPSASLARLLAASAVSEARGAAEVWRFTPASVRGALDAGWRGEDLLAELRAVSGRALPQPLEYLINDVARRHGHVRVRGTRSCVVADEATITEILHLRSLGKLHFSRVAPTVVASPRELDEVLTGLRAAGLYPVTEDAEGTVIVEAGHDHQAADTRRATAMRPAARLAAADLARQLATDPRGQAARAVDGSVTFELLTQLNGHLDDAELELLSEAVEHHDDVMIAYRDKNGSRTVRLIRPEQVHGKWLDSWCHLRNAQRDFTVANIEAVAPAGRAD
jgi:hypothetical protein